MRRFAQSRTFSRSAVVCALIALFAWSTAESATRTLEHGAHGTADHPVVTRASVTPHFGITTSGRSLIHVDVARRPLALVATAPEFASAICSDLAVLPYKSVLAAVKAGRDSALSTAIPPPQQ